MTKSENIEISKITSVGWMNVDHYHYKECQSEVPCIWSFGWKLEGGIGPGVRRMGICDRCDLLLVENEKGPLLWVSFKNPK